jgi:DNA-binding transcriptional ArsR family regulator
MPDLARIFKALGHPSRLRIVSMLEDDELCACQITAVLGLAASTVSAHLAQLRRAGLVAERKEGRWVHYRLGESADAVEITEWLSRRVRRDAEIRRDKRVLRQLRKFSVEDLCAVNLDLTQLAVTQTG